MDRSRLATAALLLAGAVGAASCSSTPQAAPQESVLDAGSTPPVAEKFLVPTSGQDVCALISYDMIDRYSQDASVSRSRPSESSPADPQPSPTGGAVVRHSCNWRNMADEQILSMVVTDTALTEADFGGTKTVRNRPAKQRATDFGPELEVLLPEGETLTITLTRDGKRDVNTADERAVATLAELVLKKMVRLP